MVSHDVIPLHSIVTTMGAAITRAVPTMHTAISVGRADTPRITGNTSHVLITGASLKTKLTYIYTHVHTYTCAHILSSLSVSLCQCVCICIVLIIPRYINVHLYRECMVGGGNSASPKDTNFMMNHGGYPKPPQLSPSSRQNHVMYSNEASGTQDWRHISHSSGEQQQSLLN